MRAVLARYAKLEGAGLGPGGAAEHGGLDLRGAEAAGARAGGGARGGLRRAGPSGPVPAEGYPAAHAAEQGRIIREALEARGRPERGPLPTVAAAGEAKG